MRLLDGVVEDPSDSDLDDLRSENRSLRTELAQARAETKLAQRASAQALGALRKQLSPLYQALQAVFGELDAAGIDAEDTPKPVNARTSAVWDAWKSRMGSAAKVIEALQLHGDLNTQQLAVATGLHRTTIPALIYKLNKNGLLNKSGGRFSLKSL